MPTEELEKTHSFKLEMKQNQGNSVNSAKDKGWDGG